MRNLFKASLLVLSMMTAACETQAQTPEKKPMATGTQTDVKDIKDKLLGNWESIAPEIRPSTLKNADGSLKPFYLKRAFKYLPSDEFELEVVNSADPYGAAPLAKIKIRGHMIWRGPHPITPGAQKVDFIADEAYNVTPIAQGFVDVLNKVAADGYNPWAVNAEHLRQDVRSVRAEAGHQLHGIRSRLSPG